MGLAQVWGSCDDRHLAEMSRWLVGTYHHRPIRMCHCGRHNEPAAEDQRRAATMASAATYSFTGSGGS
jgi:hypothetical protein